MRGRNTGVRGQVVPLVALQLWLIAGVMILIALVGERAVTRSRAQSAADAAALALATGGDAAAVAGANGAVLSRSQDVGSTVDVVVRVGDVEAAARAARTRAPGLAGLDERLVGAIVAAEVLLGEPVPIVSGLRSRAEQERLWANRATNPYPVAPPGTSLHERGLAIDVPPDFVARLSSVAGAVGLCHPLPFLDPVHFVLCGT